MRSAVAIVVTLLTIGFIYILDKQINALPPLGRLLDPQSGWAANADNEFKKNTVAISVKELQEPVIIWWEDRKVPHIKAANDHDLYFTQGYIHAYHRLWQMDMQTRAAAGRVGEVVGEKWVEDEITGKKKNIILEFDRGQRRKGMVFGAEHKLKMMEADPRTRAVLDAYTAGVNHFIRSLKYKDYPLEYKLMAFKPELWTNLKTALMIMNMADDLTGKTEDFEMSVLRDYLPETEMNYLFPLRTPNSIPVIPGGTKFPEPSLKKPAVPEADIWTHFSKKNFKSIAKIIQPEKDKPIQHSTFSIQHYSSGVGSNNWAISGNKTQSGAAILCNDPHLALNLPSIWYEMQLQSDGVNVYGVSLPGAPGIIIGFNDSISWGLTNNYRDVKDFYEIEVLNNSSYRFDGKSIPFDKQFEIIKIKGKPDFIDKVNYTLHGPVIYDSSFPDPLYSGKSFAVTWMAHRPSNELLAVYLMNRAHSYDEYTQALYHFVCPAQNFVYADRKGNIAMNGQGQFVNKWEGQGRYVMKGNTSATLWGGNIPMEENPFVLNPSQEYLVSANQMTTDSTYPYWYNGYFSDFREWEIHHFLSKNIMNAPDSLWNINNMKTLQNNVMSWLISKLASVAPLSLSNQLTPHTVEGAVFQVWWYFLYKNIWEDEFSHTPKPLFPKEEITMQLILSDSGSVYYDDKRTATKETLQDMIIKSHQQAEDSLEKIKSISGTEEWYKVKGTQLTHLTKIDAFSYKNLKIGGWGNTINAVKKTHGPSWRMIVEMGKDSIEAFGVYPGGQSGNPGSKYYGNLVDKWVKGAYYRLLFLSKNTTKKPSAINQVWQLSP